MKAVLIFLIFLKASVAQCLGNDSEELNLDENHTKVSEALNLQALVEQDIKSGEVQDLRKSDALEVLPIQAAPKPNLPTDIGSSESFDVPSDSVSQIEILDEYSEIFRRIKSYFTPERLIPSSKDIKAWDVLVSEIFGDLENSQTLVFLRYKLFCIAKENPNIDFIKELYQAINRTVIEKLKLNSEDRKILTIQISEVFKDHNFGALDESDYKGWEARLRHLFGVDYNMHDSKSVRSLANILQKLSMQENNSNIESLSKAAVRLEARLRKMSKAIKYVGSSASFNNPIKSSKDVPSQSEHREVSGDFDPATLRDVDSSASFKNPTCLDAEFNEDQKLILKIINEYFRAAPQKHISKINYKGWISCGLSIKDLWDPNNQNDFKSFRNHLNKISTYANDYEVRRICSNLYKAVQNADKVLPISLPPAGVENCLNSAESQIVVFVKDMCSPESPNYFESKNIDDWRRIALKIKIFWDPENEKKMHTLRTYIYHIRDIYKSLSIENQSYIDLAKAISCKFVKECDRLGALNLLRQMDSGTDSSDATSAHDYEVLTDIIDSEVSSTSNQNNDPASLEVEAIEGLGCLFSEGLRHCQNSLQNYEVPTSIIRNFMEEIKSSKRARPETEEPSSKRARTK
jgi:hypothetical protein